MNLSADDIRKFKEDDLNKKIQEQQQQLFDLQMQLRTKGLRNNQILKVIRRNIARIKTIHCQLKSKV